MRAFAIVFFCVAACSSRVPDVPPEAFACTADTVEEDGELQCPETHRCDNERCRPRLDCVEPGSATPGCTEGTNRCELTIGEETAGVSCEGGLYTIPTSTVPSNVERCECPGELTCALLAEKEAGDSLDEPRIFLGAPQLPQEITENPLGRICVMPCATEADCPANHTCYPSVVLDRGTLPADGRFTIGACWPQILITTATVADLPDPTACRTEGDCTEAAGREDGLCRVDVVPIPDNKVRPAGAAWSDRLALIPRCREDNLSGLLLDGRGCTDSNDCQSGVCHAGRCAKLCNPENPEICAFGADCTAEIVSRSVPNGVTILDRLFICGS